MSSAAHQGSSACVVHIADFQVAGGTVAGNPGACFDGGTTVIASNHCCIVGAVDGDVDGLLSAVSGLNDKGVGQDIANVQGLNRGLVVVDCVSPVACGINRSGAVSSAAHQGSSACVVHIADRQVAGGTVA